MADTPPSSGGAKILLPLIVIAAAVVAGWLWMQKPADESMQTSAAALNAVAPAADETAPAGMATQDDGDEDDVNYGTTTSSGPATADESGAVPGEYMPESAPDQLTTMPVESATPQEVVPTEDSGVVSEPPVEGSVTGSEAPATDETKQVPPVVAPMETSPAPVSGE